MLHYTTGNLLDSQAEVLVNTVNTVGVMGKGIALQFKEAYPHNFSVYRTACREGAFQIGQILAVADQDAFGPRTIVNFPTKQHWRSPSRYEYIEAGLVALAQYLIETRPAGIAIPPLGCGNGGLEWERVREMIEQHLADLPLEIYLYAPNPAIRQQLRESSPEREIELTPARAMLLQGLFLYEDEGDPASLFVANKIAYFLQLLGQPMRLTFKKHYYGPYAPQMNAFARVFNGSFLRGLEQGNARPFEPLPLNYDRYPELADYLERELTPEQRQLLRQLDELLTGYKSAYALEVLATVACIRQENPGYGVAEIIAEAEQWSTRKKYLLQPRHVRLALERLQAYEAGSLATLRAPES